MAQNLITLTLQNHNAASTYTLNNGLDKVLRGMPKSLITETLYEVPKYCFWKRKFINAKKKY